MSIILYACAQCITENSENSNSDSESESNESDNKQLHSDEINQGEVRIAYYSTNCCLILQYKVCIIILFCHRMRNYGHLRTVNPMKILHILSQQ